MGDGVYYALMDGYRAAASSDPKSRKAAVERFTQFYGEFFENYVVDCLSTGLRNRNDATIRGETPQPPGEKTTDAIITEGNDVIFVEVVAKRMHFLDSVLHLDAAAIDRDLKAAVTDKAKELKPITPNCRA